MKPALQIEKGVVDSVIAHIAGELVVKYHKEMMTIFKKVMATNGNVSISIDSPESIDLCFIQLLSAFKNQCSREGRAVSISSVLHEPEAKLMARLRLLHLLNYKTTQSLL
jgi:hypothetical protein